VTEEAVEVTSLFDTAATPSAITPVFSFDSIGGIINFSILSVILVAIIVFLVVIFIKMIRIDDEHYDYYEQLRGKCNSLKNSYEELNGKIDNVERNLDRFKKNSDDRFYGMDRDLLDLSNDVFMKKQESVSSKKNKKTESNNSKSVQNLTTKEKYNLYLNNQCDLPKEFNGTECSFSEYGNQLEKKSNGVFYSVNCGNNKYEVYPSKNVILDDRMRPRYLDVSFFEVARGQSNNVEPCILQESMLGKYDIISKGTVYFK